MNAGADLPSLRALLADPAPTVAASFTAAVGGDRLDELVRAGLDVAELRIDRFGSTAVDDVVQTVQAFARVPTLATVRTRDEGGDWAGTDEERLGLFEAVLPYVDGVDVELGSTAILERVVGAAQALGRVVVVSHHDFEGTPSAARLRSVADAASSVGADVVKVAAMARSAGDLATLTRFLLDRSGLRLVVIAMGSHGSLSRVAFPALGSALAFAHLGEHAVPGQLDLDDTVALLSRFSPDYSTARDRRRGG